MTKVNVIGFILSLIVLTCARSYNRGILPQVTRYPNIFKTESEQDTKHPRTKNNFNNGKEQEPSDDEVMKKIDDMLDSLYEDGSNDEIPSSTKHKDKIKHSVSSKSGTDTFLTKAEEIYDFPDYDAGEEEAFTAPPESYEKGSSESDSIEVFTAPPISRKTGYNANYHDKEEEYRAPSKRKNHNLHDYFHFGVPKQQELLDKDVKDLDDLLDIFDKVNGSDKMVTSSEDIFKKILNNKQDHKSIIFISSISSQTEEKQNATEEKINDAPIKRQADSYKNEEETLDDPDDDSPKKEDHDEDDNEEEEETEGDSDKDQDDGYPLKDDETEIGVVPLEKIQNLNKENLNIENDKNMKENNAGLEIDEECDEEKVEEKKVQKYLKIESDKNKKVNNAALEVDEDCDEETVEDAESPNVSEAIIEKKRKKINDLHEEEYVDDDCTEEEEDRTNNDSSPKDYKLERGYVVQKGKDQNKNNVINSPNNEDVDCDDEVQSAVSQKQGDNLPGLPGTELKISVFSVQDPKLPMAEFKIISP